LSALVIEDIKDAGEIIVVRARTRDGAVACPGCGAETGRVHGYHERTAADVPADGRRVVLKVRARRMRCPVTGCKVQTFREQVPGVLDRYQRRTTWLTGQSFAALLAPDRGNDARLRKWITDARAADLPHVHSFTRGLGLDIQAATAALTMPHHNGRTEGVNTIKDDQAADVRTRRLHPATPDSPRLRLRTVTAESATEPFKLQSHAHLE